jgi:hypothetical protein
VYVALVPVVIHCGWQTGSPLLLGFAAGLSSRYLGNGFNFEAELQACKATHIASARDCRKEPRGRDNHIRRPPPRNSHRPASQLPDRTQDSKRSRPRFLDGKVKNHPLRRPQETDDDRVFSQACSSVSVGARQAMGICDIELRHTVDRPCCNRSFFMRCTWASSVPPGADAASLVF